MAEARSDPLMRVCNRNWPFGVLMVEGMVLPMPPNGLDLYDRIDRELDLRDVPLASSNWPPVITGRPRRSVTGFRPSDTLSAQLASRYWPTDVTGPGCTVANFTASDLRMAREAFKRREENSSYYVPTGEYAFMGAGADADAAADLPTMFLAKRNTRPYKLVQVQGFQYAVEDRGSPEDEEIALTLHELNQFSIDVIGFIGRYIAAAKAGRVPAYDLDIDISRLTLLYNRLRVRYSVDDVYEAVSGISDDTSYVINLGEEIHMCVRGEHTRDKMVVLYTVMTHELSHVASSTPDHDAEFWDNYGLLRRVVAKMGIVRLEDIPENGGTHCQKIRIDKSEMAEIASKYTPAPMSRKMAELVEREESQAGYFSMAPPPWQTESQIASGQKMFQRPRIKMVPSYTIEQALAEDPDPMWKMSGDGTYGLIGARAEGQSHAIVGIRPPVMTNPFYGFNRSPYASESSPLNARYRLQTEGGPGRDVIGEFDWRYGYLEKESPEMYRTPLEKVYLGNSSTYSRHPYVMGATDIIRGESLHTSIPLPEYYSRWTR